MSAGLWRDSPRTHTSWWSGETGCSKTPKLGSPSSVNNDMTLARPASNRYHCLRAAMKAGFREVTFDHLVVLMKKMRMTYYYNDPMSAVTSDDSFHGK